MSSTAVNRINGAILVPLEFNPQPGPALEHAAVLKAIYHTDIVLIVSSAANIPASVNGQYDEKIVLKSSFDKWLKTKGAEAAYVVVSKPLLKKKQVPAAFEKLLRTSLVPVVSVGKWLPPSGYLNILMPLDLTRESTQKVSHAITFSKADPRIRIQVISVLFSVDDFMINRLTKQIEEVRYTLEQNGVLCAAELVKTDESERMADVVAEIASRNETDLIMIISQLDDKGEKPRLHQDVIDIVAGKPFPVLTLNPAAFNQTPS